MLKLLFKQTWYIVIILVLIIIEPTLNSLLNFELQNIFNVVVEGINVSFILRLITIIFFLWIFKRVLSYISSVIKARFITNAKQEVKHRLFAKMMHMDTGNLSRIASSGQYISIFTNDMTLLENRYFEQIISLVGNLFSLVILGSSLFVLNVKLAIVISGFGLLTFFIPMIYSKTLNRKNLLYSDSLSYFTQRMKEFMVAYPMIKNYSIEPQISRVFNEINRGTEKARFESEATLALANNTGQMLSWFMQFIGVGLGLVLVAKGEILIGTVIAAQSFASDIANPLQGILQNINNIRSVNDLVKKMESLTEIKEDELKETVEFDESLPMDIEFDKYSLTLDDSKIIDDFSFTFKEGKKYLVVGLNGSGKSTIFKSLKKWYDPTSGTIRINNRDISSLTSEQLSSKISYLNENVSLISGTVKDNIVLFRDTYTEEEINRVIKEAQIKIELDRVIIDEGRNISSGETRRIEIARSLLGKVKVIIFDEVVSTLDIETAYEIEKMVLGFKDQTVVFVSHNFSGKLIKEYDEILVMENGHLLAHGPYSYLIDNCDYFKKICDIKFGI